MNPNVPGPFCHPRKVSMDWIIPGNLPAFPRIYAVIDPEGVLDEIHENNNVGWTVIGHSEFSSGIDDKLVESGAAGKNLTTAYPNPFTASFSIEFKSKRAELVSVMLFDSKGSLVYEPETVEPAGLNRIEIPGENLVPGVYYYRFSNRLETETRMNQSFDLLPRSGFI